jgi:transposase
MTRIPSITQDTVLVAIDISKKRNDVLIQVPGSPRRRRLVVLNQRAEHDRFIQRLKAFDRPVVTGFEATGNYHRALAWRLATRSHPQWMGQE